MKKNLLLCMCMLFVACQSGKKEKIDKTEILEIDFPNIEPLSAEKIEDLFFVPLETTDEILLNNRLDICFYDSLIYVKADRMDRLVIFDMKGKIQKILDRKGPGPEEYDELRNFTVNDDGIFIYDQTRGSMVLYQKDGTFKNRVKFSSYPGSYVYLYKDKYIGYLTQPAVGRKAMYIYNSEGELLREYFDDKGYDLEVSLHQDAPLFNDGTGCFISFFFDNNVYYFDGDTIIERFKFDFKDYNMTDSQKKYFADHFWDGYEERNPDNCIYGIDNVIQNGNWNYFMFHRIFFSRLFLNQSENKMYKIPMDDLFLANMGGRIFAYGDYFVCVMSASNAVNFQNRDPKKDLYPQIEDLREMNITEEDNPILCFFKLKD